MSHVVKVKDVQMTDSAAIQAAVDRMEGTRLLAGMNSRTYKLYGSSEKGIGIQLKGWEYPVIVDPETGKVKYDNFGGTWGAQGRLDELIQAYSVEKMRLTALSRGMTLQEMEDPETHDITLVCTSYQ